MAMNVLQVDQELKPNEIQRHFSISNQILIMYPFILLIIVILNQNP
jgi:hypothetical protein